MSKLIEEFAMFLLVIVLTLGIVGIFSVIFKAAGDGTLQNNNTTVDLSYHTEEVYSYEVPS